MASNSKRRPHHENGAPRKRQNRKRSKGMHAGVRERVHLLHHQRGLRKVPAGEAQDCQWGGYPFRHDFAWLRELLGSFEDLPVTLPRNPPRKSEQASRARPVPSWGQRAQHRRESGPTCTERRLGNGRRRRHRVRIHGAQRQRLRRLLGVSGSGGPRGGRCSRAMYQISEDRTNSKVAVPEITYIDHRKRRRRRERGGQYVSDLEETGLTLDRRGEEE